MTSQPKEKERGDFRMLNIKGRIINSQPKGKKKREKFEDVRHKRKDNQAKERF